MRIKILSDSTCDLPESILKQYDISLTPLSVIAIIIIVIGVLGVGYLENNGETQRKKNLGKKLAIIAFCMPFVYATLDAFGSFVDIFYLDDFATTPLIGVTEETIEDVANTSYELTFALVGLILFIFMKSKKVAFGPVPQHKSYFSKMY